MTAGVSIALMALSPSLRWGYPHAVGVSASDNADETVPEGALAEPA
jgi:hypothetical protein